MGFGYVLSKLKHYAGHVALASFLTLFFDLAIFTMAECGGTKRLCRPSKRQKEIPIYS